MSVTGPHAYRLTHPGPTGQTFPARPGHAGLPVDPFPVRPRPSALCVQGKAARLHGP